jgi:hypothetical protein
MGLSSLVVTFWQDVGTPVSEGRLLSLKWGKMRFSEDHFRLSVKKVKPVTHLLREL